jgi:hypothetical protein
VGGAGDRARAPAVRGLPLVREGHGGRGFVAGLCPPSHETLTSWASHGGHGLPGPPWGAQGTATRTGATAPNYAANSSSTDSGMSKFA